VRVDVEHDHVGIRPTVDETRIQDIGVPPVVGERQRVAVISDLHLGSKYCLREQLIEFVRYAYASGVRQVLCPGDVLDGCYKHGLWELSHHGVDAQTDDLIEVLPHLPGLSYHAITGNHDETFEDTCGMSVGQFITDRFRSRGRHDIRFYGRRGAFLRIGGAIVELWHPRGGGAYAKTYKLQKKIEGYPVGHKPHLLLTGHWHQFGHVYERGVHGFLCPTFQGGGSAFGKSLGGAPTIGGLMLSWDMTEGGTMRQFVSEYRAYFEAERIHCIDGAA
jgi:DNA polymerase II small subunit/DNA polymerase delta subunit B